MAIDLAPYAAQETSSRGRIHPEPGPVYRTEYQRDRDRVIHSTAFRRLEYKTQVFVNHEGDLFRTRLTHTIEVAQIARSIARALQLNEDLTEAIALAHDLGHAPFGHAGQKTLNECLRNYGGFEHNLQALRIVDQLEEKYADFPGLNLTFETREGILKHCSRSLAQTLGDLGSRFLEGEQPGLEAQLTNLADEIAYNSHDVDDGLRSGLLEMEQLASVDLFREQYEAVKAIHPRLTGRRVIHEIVRRMINTQIVDLIENSRMLLNDSAPEHIDEVRRQPHPLVAFSPTMRARNRELKTFLHEHLYRNFRVHRMSLKAEQVIQSLFEAFTSDPRTLPDDAHRRVQIKQQTDGEAGLARVVADYIAGMTDRYAITEHARLFDPAQRS